MSRTAPQLNVRSAYARQRVQALARRTGRSTTQIIEDALRAYEPVGTTVPERQLLRKGRLLVMTGGPPTSLEQWNAELEAARNERADDILSPRG